MSGAASVRELECTYVRWLALPFWPSHKYCSVRAVDFSAKFKKEKHSFSVSASLKSEVKTFEIRSLRVDFIPLEIVDEFPNLNGIIIWGENLRTVKAGLFRAELNRIEYLWLDSRDV
jgi:hypothetical protein